MTELVTAVAEHAKESGVGIAALCRTVGLSRATFYRCSKPQTLSEATETDLHEAIQQIALTFSCYGFTSV